jgi:hypothetical protein
VVTRQAATGATELARQQPLKAGDSCRSQAKEQYLLLSRSIWKRIPEVLLQFRGVQAVRNTTNKTFTLFGQLSGRPFTSLLGTGVFPTKRILPVNHYNADAEIYEHSAMAIAIRPGTCQGQSPRFSFDFAFLSREYAQSSSCSDTNCHLLNGRRRFDSADGIRSSTNHTDS